MNKLKKRDIDMAERILSIECL